MSTHTLSLPAGDVIVAMLLAQRSRIDQALQAYLSGDPQAIRKTQARALPAAAAETSSEVKLDARRGRGWSNEERQAASARAKAMWARKRMLARRAKKGASQVAG